MFTGDFKAKKGISLGGASKAVDKAALLRKAQADRLAREQEKKRETSAARIQAFLRGRNDVGNRRMKEREAFGAKTTTSTTSSIYADTRSLLFFCNPPTNKNDLDALVNCVACLNNKDILQSLNKQDAWFIVTFPNLLILCIKSANSSNQAANETLLTFVLTVLQDPTLSTSSLPSTLIAKNIILTLQTLITTTPSPSETPFKITTTLLSLVPPFHSTLLQTSRFLSTPSLSAKCPTHYLPHFLATFPLAQTLDFIASSNPTTIFSDTHARAYFLSNVVGFLDTLLVKSGGGDLVHAMLVMIYGLMDSFPVGYFARVSDPDLMDDLEDDEDEDDVDDGGDSMDVDRKSVGDGGATKKSRFESMDSLDGGTKSVLGMLVDGGFLKRVVEWACRFSLDGGEVDALDDVLRFLVLLVYHWPTKKSSVLGVVAFRKSMLVTKVVQRLKEGRLWGLSEVRSGWGGLLSERSLENEWWLVVGLAEVLALEVQILTDKEVEELRDPVTLADVVQFSGVLRNVLFHMYWTNTVDFTPRTATAVLPKYTSQITDTFTMLLDQLYARDSRRSFCPQGHWQMISDLEMQTFIENAIADPSIENPGTITTPTQVRLVSSTSPRHQILTKMPYVIPFETRAKIFRAWIYGDRIASGLDDAQWLRPRARVSIRRSHIFEDAYKTLSPLGPALKNRIAITFVSALDGEVEAGIDGGGVFKEFLSELLREVFGENRVPLFTTTPDHLIYPAPLSDDKMHLRYMEFFGRVLGKALYEGVLIDAEFAGFFLSKWLNRQSYLDDLRTLDVELYNGLMFLKTYTGDVERDLALNFTAVEEGGRVVEIVPGGAGIPVTKENRIAYIYRMANYKLNVRIGRPCRAFFEGLNTLINAKWLKIFNQSELQLLLGGATTPIDLEDLKRNITYGGDFHELHPTIRLFWDVVESEDVGEEDRRLLLKFVTSCARPPLLGFAELKPGFCIRPSGESEDRLPSASTCVNMLKLPEYKTREALRSKLLYAVRSNAGFELS
ncbi:hypothetical protein HDU79_010513 [Rhizoclosmatium sp. JEL0117]|nr:hypothetical protein HDU79_010513 [Rhizoclosmatium sp. JEL0117]